MPKGLVKKYFAEKGYGFISNGGESDDDIFFHINDVVGDWSRGAEPSEGDPVSFKVQKSSKGLDAKDVRSLES